MNEQEKLNERIEANNNQATDTSIDYISAINEMKRNTVDRDSYDKLREENKRLLNSLVNGETLPNQEVVEKRSIDEIRDELFNREQTNLDYVKNALELRERLIESGEMDPFLPYGKKIIPTDDDIATANRVAKALQDCVDYADGDSEIFTNELQRITIDTGLKRR